MISRRLFKGLTAVSKNGGLSGLNFLYKTNSLLRHSSTMKAVTINSYGDPHVLQVNEVERPKPGNNEVLVKVFAAGINPIDVLMREGAFVRLPPLPLILGKEAAGVIDAVGPDVKNHKVGDRVTCCLPYNGGYAEFVVCEENKLIALPSKLSYVKGCSLYVTYFVALRALLTSRIKKGETLLVHGASGGVGVAAIQYAKSKGMKVFGSVGSKRGEEVAKQAGADFVFSHKEDDYFDDMLSVNEKGGFDVIVENNAETNLGKDFLVLNPGGRIVIVGTKPIDKSTAIKKRNVQVNPRQLMVKEGSVHAVNLLRVTPEEFKEYSSIIVKGINEGWLDPIISRQFKFQQAPEAHTRMKDSPAAGKLVFNLEL